MAFWAGIIWVYNSVNSISEVILCKIISFMPGRRFYVVDVCLSYLRWSFGYMSWEIGKIWPSVSIAEFSSALKFKLVIL